MAKSPSIEDTFEKLDNILSEMESGELTMNESFKKYKNVIPCLIRWKRKWLF